MKYILRIVLTIAGFSAYAQSVISIDDAFRKSHPFPASIPGNSVLKTDSKELVILSPEEYTLLQNLQNQAKENTTLSEELARSYKENMTAQQRDYDSLMQKYRELDSICASSRSVTQTGLQRVQKNLSKSDSLVVKSSTDVDLARKEIKSQRWKWIRSNSMSLVTGLIVGLTIGIIIHTF